MRLICPRCDATYDVEDAAIPASGRRVRCAACDESWRVSGDGVTLSLEDAKQAVRAGTAVLAMSRTTAIETLAPRRRPTPDVAEAETTSEGAPGAAVPVETIDAVASPYQAGEPVAAEGEGATAEADAPIDAPLPDAPDPNEQPAEASDMAEAEESTPAAAAPESAPDAIPPVRPKFGPSPKSLEIPAAPKSAARDKAEEAEQQENAESPLRGVLGFVIGFALVILLASPYLFRVPIVMAYPEAEPVVAAYAETIAAVQNSIRNAYAYLAHEVGYLVNGSSVEAEIGSNPAPSAPPASAGQ